MEQEVFEDIDTMEAHEYVRQSDHAGRITDSPSDKKQKAATALLRDAIQIRDFAAPIAARASKIFGPINKHLTAQNLPMMCNAERASRPIGTLRVLCNGMRTAQRFHMDGEASPVTNPIKNTVYYAAHP